MHHHRKMSRPMGTVHRFRASISAFALLVAVVVPSPAAAATSCSGSGVNEFDARYTTTSNTMGTSGLARTRFPTLCTGTGSYTFSSAWTMLTGPGNSGWAQTGYWRQTTDPFPQMHGFSQVLRRDDGFDVAVTKNWPSPAIDSVHSYQSYVLSSGPSAGYIVMYIDANRVATSTFKPVDYWGAQPWSNQFGEETFHCQTDVPGIDAGNTKVHFTGLASLHNGSWVAPSPTLQELNCGSKYAQANVSATAWDFWTAIP